MTATRRAVIDIGTNSVKLLVADVDGKAVHPVLEESEQTRLGAGLYQDHRLQPKAIADTARAVATFAEEALKAGAASTRVIATSAAREATNSGDLTDAIQRACGAKVEIITGETEADLIFRGVTALPGLEHEPVVLMDVGGGSTEFILGQNEHKLFRESFRVGALRLLQLSLPSDPPTGAELAGCRRWIREFLDREVTPRLGPLLQAGERKLVATGGTAAILARMEGRMDGFDRDRIEAIKLSEASVRNWVECLWSLPLAQRRETPGLPAPRADVILTGVAIFEGVMECLGFAELRVSTRGLRFAAVMDPE